MLDLVDLEDIQKKRKKLIPNFSITDGFANGTGQKHCCLSYCDDCQLIALCGLLNSFKIRLDTHLASQDVMYN